MKKETLAEYLARGGKITVIPPVLPTKSETVKPKPASGPNTLMSIEDGELYYGEAKAKKAKKATTAIDLSAHLPEALRKKYVDSIINANEEDDE
jgi:hypothetical protein